MFSFGFRHFFTSAAFVIITVATFICIVEFGASVKGFLKPFAHNRMVKVGVVDEIFIYVFAKVS